MIVQYFIIWLFTDISLQHCWELLKARRFVVPLAQDFTGPNSWRFHDGSSTCSVSRGLASGIESVCCWLYIITMCPTTIPSIQSTSAEHHGRWALGSEPMAITTIKTVQTSAGWGYWGNTNARSTRSTRGRGDKFSGVGCRVSGRISKTSSGMFGQEQPCEDEMMKWFVVTIATT